MDKIKEFLTKLNQYGIPVPVFKDGVTGLPSVTFTLFYVNGVIAILGLLGRFANLVAGVDADAAKELLMVTGGLYLGRTLVRAVDATGKKTTTLDASPESK